MSSFLRHRLWGAIAACIASASPFVHGQTAKLPAKNIQLTVSNGTARFQGASLDGTSGSPALPKYTLSFLLPPGTDPKSVTVQIDGLKQETLSGRYDVAPVPARSTQGKEFWPKGARISNGRDLDAYGRNSFAPASHLGATRFGTLGSYQLLEVDIHDYLYNPVSGQLRRLVDGTVSVRVAAAGKVATLSGPATAGTANLKLADQLRGLVVNFDQAIGAYAPAQAGASKLAAAATTYTILTTETIAQSSAKLGAFADVKAAAGFQVELVTGTSNYVRTAGAWVCRFSDCEGGWGGGKGNAAAESLRTWLKANYLSHNIEYALLVGNPDTDTGNVPMKMMWPRLLEETYPEAPTDYYFAELTGNWDLNGDGFYGQEGVDDGIGGMDKFCEIAVGRIPFYGSISDLDRILSKTIRYMQETDVSWRSNVLFSMRQMFDPFVNHRVGELLKSELLAPKGWGTYRIYDSAFGVSPEKTPTTEPNVLDAWKNNAFGYHMWLTHGFSQGAGDIFSSQSAPLLDDLHPSFTFQLSCYTAFPEDPNNLAYALLKNGGIATVGATRVSWLWADEQVFDNDDGSYGSLANKFTRYLVRDTLPVGKALSKLRATTINWWMNMQDFNVYGDPSLLLGNAPIRPPSRPIGLAAESGDRRLGLTWTPSTNASSYTIRRATSANGPFATLASSVVVSNYEDVDVANGSTYFYTVSATNPAGQSANSDTIQATPKVPTNPLQLQYRVGDASATDNQIKPYFAVVNTGNRTESIAGMKIRYWFSNDNGSALQATLDWAQMGATHLAISTGTPANTVAGADKFIEVTFLSGAPSLAPGATTGDIQMRVNHTDWTSFTESGDYSWDPTAKTYGPTDRSCLYSATGDLIGGVEPGFATLPAVPTGLTATAGNSVVSLKWNASRQATSYEIFRAVAPNAATLLGTATDTVFADRTVQNGTTYAYSVTAKNAAGTSAKSTEVSVTPAGSPSAPSIVSVVPDDSKAMVTWTAVASASFYSVKVTKTPGDTVTLSITSPATSLEFHGLINGTAYTFVVSASNNFGQSANSTPVVATPRSSSEPCSPASNMTGGNSGNFNTTAAVCKRTTSNISGWGCSNFSGRTVKVNGVSVACGAALPAKTSTGYYYFDISAGAYSWASMYWW